MPAAIANLVPTTPSMRQPIIAAAGIAVENRAQLLVSTAGDTAEAMQAFLEKRPSRYTDR